MAEDNWVFDSLGMSCNILTLPLVNINVSVGFLRGPVWNVPILTFVEHKSLSKLRIKGYF